MTRFILVIFISSILLGCTKPNKTTQSSTDYPGYLALKPGNYWVYEEYELDSVTRAAVATGFFDSDYVEKDTIVNGNTYHKCVYDDVLPTNGLATYSFALLRDSMAYVVNQFGYNIFSSSDFVTKDTSYEDFSGDTAMIVAYMSGVDSVITVPAGTFHTLSHEAVFYYYKPSYGSSWIYHNRYANGVGLVIATTSNSPGNENVYEKRLLRYHVQ